MKKNALTKILDYSERLLAALCVASFATMFLLGVTTIVFRFIIQSSLAFPDELIRYLFVWMVALGVAIAMRRNLHAAIAILVNRLPGEWRRAVLLFSSVCTASFMVVLLVNGVYLTVRASQQISPALEVSMAWVYSALPVGAAFTLLYVLEQCWIQLHTPIDDLRTDSV